MFSYFCVCVTRMIHSARLFCKLILFGFYIKLTVDKNHITNPRPPRLLIVCVVFEVKHAYLLSTPIAQDTTLAQVIKKKNHQLPKRLSFNCRLPCVVQIGFVEVDFVGLFKD